MALVAHRPFPLGDRNIEPGTVLSGADAEAVEQNPLLLARCTFVHDSQSVASPVHDEDD
jgi:hypothetical protein